MKRTFLIRVALLIAALTVIAPVSGHALRRDDTRPPGELPWTWTLGAYRVNHRRRR